MGWRVPTSYGIFFFLSVGELKTLTLRTENQGKLTTMVHFFSEEARHFFSFFVLSSPPPSLSHTQTTKRVPNCSPLVWWWIPTLEFCRDTRRLLKLEPSRWPVLILELHKVILFFRWRLTMFMHQKTLDSNYFPSQQTYVILLTCNGCLSSELVRLCLFFFWKESSVVWKWKMCVCVGGGGGTSGFDGISNHLPELFFSFSNTLLIKVFARNSTGLER